jgi:hypothetical protein
LSWNAITLLQTALRRFKLGSVAVSELVHNLNDKTKYIIHYRNLKLYLGLRLTWQKFTESWRFNKVHGSKPT